MRIAALILLLLGSAIPVHALAAETTVNGIAARVDQKLIFWSDVVRAARSKGLSSLAEGDPGQVRERLIEDVLVEQEAESIGRSITDEQVQQSIERFAAQNNMSFEQLKQSVLREGVDWTEYEDIVRSQLLRAEVVQARVRSTVVVTESDVESTYKELYRPETEVYLTLAAVSGGQDIDLGWIKPVDAMESVRGAIVAYFDGAAPGSQRVEVNGSFYKVLVEDTRLSGGPGLETVYDQIHTTLFQERVAQAFANWLSSAKAARYIERMAIPASVSRSLSPTE